MKLRAITALAVAVVGMLFFTPVATAGAYPPAICPSLAVSTTHPLPGETITVSGVNFTPHASVHLVLKTTTYDLATVTADGDGSFSTPVKLPAGVIGTHTIVAVSGADTSVCGRPHVVIHIQPTAPSSPTGKPPGGTSFTGVDLLMILLAAAVLLGAGVAFNRSGKNRHASVERV